MSDLSISKSVARAFEVLEYFRGSRQPCSTPDLERALNYPYSSARVILKTLNELGYLRYDRTEKTYFPTQKLMQLGDWVQNATIESEGLLALLDCIHERVNETVALTMPSFIFCNLFQVRNGNQPMCLKLPGGVGRILVNSTAGRVLMSQMGEAQIDALIAHTRYWVNSSKAPVSVDKTSIMHSIDFIRAHGYLADYDGFRKDVGSISFPVATAMPGFPLAVLVTGPVTRMKYSEASIRRIMERLLGQRSRAQAALQVVPPPRAVAL